MAIKIVFMGTPDFAVPALKALYNKGYEIPLVVTQPDKPKGRGKKLIPTPVKSAALEIGCKVIQPPSINEADVIEEIESVSADIFVVVAFGQFLSERLLAIPTYAPINIHASLLPEYRGSAPIHRAILNGKTLTGVTTMFMDKGMDTGDILLRAETEITKDDTAETLHDRLASIGAELVVETVECFRHNSIARTPQNRAKATHAPMLCKKEGLINWEKSSHELDCFVRGMTPWPGAYTFLNDKRLKVFILKEIDMKTDKKPGTIIDSKPDELLVATGSGVVSILEIQGASGKRLKAADFLRGFKLKTGDYFTNK